MKIIITERQLTLIERIIKNKVFCDGDGCDWSWDWKKETGKKDQYICHKCGHDNTPKK
jgi:hypothetical protein